MITTNIKCKCPKCNEEFEADVEVEIEDCDEDYEIRNEPIRNEGYD